MNFLLSGSREAMKERRTCWLSFVAAEMPMVHNQIKRYFPSSSAKTISKCMYLARIPSTTSVSRRIVNIQRRICSARSIHERRLARKDGENQGIQMDYSCSSSTRKESRKGLPNTFSYF